MIEVQKQRILRLRPMMFSSKMNLSFLSFYSIQEVNETNGRVIKGSPTSQSVERRTLADQRFHSKKTSFFSVFENPICVDCA